MNMRNEFWQFKIKPLFVVLIFHFNLNFQLATWMLLFCALFFFAILVGLACYCTRKEADDEDL